jgi:3'-phosphoadenosine 5'-phosphosulfate sulfotransferase (PAPS reductase)/FAD synthetase
MKQKILISFSGGRTSAFMCWFMLNSWKERDKYEMVVVFANTGKERQETLDFVRSCDRYFGFKTVWVEAVINSISGEGTTHRIVDFNTADRVGNPFEFMIAKYGMPNQNAPHCSRELKKQPIKSYARSIRWFDYQTALGIRTDEPKRLNWIAKKKEKFIYFAELMKVTKSDVNLFPINSMPLIFGLLFKSS